MNTRAKKLLAGMAIGDGYLRYNTLYVIHSENQVDYVEWKAQLLENVTGKTVKRFTKQQIVDGKLRKAVGFSFSHPYIGTIRKRLYKDGKKVINAKFLSKVSDEGIAIWYMDEGSFYNKKRNGRVHSKELVISTYCSSTEVEAIISFFKERYGVHMTVKRNKGLCSVRCGKKNALVLLDSIRQYSCPTMNYKFNV